MKYKYLLTHNKTALAFSDSPETLERLRSVMELPEAEITSTKQGPKQTIWVGPRTPIEVGK